MRTKAQHAPSRRGAGEYLDLTRAEAARRLGLAGEGGVDFHLRNMFRKYGVHRTRTLLAMAREQGWIPQKETKE